METTLILAGATAATTVLLLRGRKKRKSVYTVKNVVWWIDKHISPKMLNASKPKIVDKGDGQFAYLTSPTHDVRLRMDGLMAGVRTSKLDDDFVFRLSYVLIAKQFVGRPFLLFGLVRNKYLPQKRVKRVTILPESDSTLLESHDIVDNIEVDITKPLFIPPLYFFVKVTDSLSYFILLMNRNAVRLFEPAAVTQTQLR